MGDGIMTEGFKYIVTTITMDTPLRTSSFAVGPVPEADAGDIAGKIRTHYESMGYKTSIIIV